MKTRLTQRQNEAYEFIRSYMRDYRKPPTLKEISIALEVASPNAVYKLLQALEKKGYIKREQHAARGIRLIDADHDGFALDESLPSLPVISRTASNQPEHLRRRPTTYFGIDPYFLKNAADTEACLIGRAGDDGMNGEGIHKGDFLLIEEMTWEELDNGDLAAFLVREELQARWFEYANGEIHLRAADRTYDDEKYPPRDPRCYVIGRIIGLIRRL